MERYEELGCLRCLNSKAMSAKQRIFCIKMRSSDKSTCWKFKFNKNA